MRRWRAVAVVAAAVIAAACGVPDDRDPQVISAADAPLDLDPSDNEAPAIGPAEVRLYYVNTDVNADDELVFIPRPVDDPSLDVAIDALLAPPEGPIEGPNGQELQSVVPPDVVRLATSMSGEIATLDFGCDQDAPEPCGLRALTGATQVLVFAQLTCTADSVRGVSGVLFLHLGNPQPAPLPNTGESTTDPVACRDY